MDVRRNKRRKDGEHCAGVCIPAQHISERIFPNNYHHTQTGHIMAVTGSSITQTMGTNALDTQTPLQRQSTQSGCDSGQQRGSGMPIGESLFDSQCGKRFFRSAKHQDRLWARPGLLFDGYQVLFFIMRDGRSVKPLTSIE